MRTIELEVSDETGRAFDSANKEDRRRLEVLFEINLESYLRNQDSLEVVMRRIGKRAKERGLTEQLLQDLLGRD